MSSSDQKRLNRASILLGVGTVAFGISIAFLVIVLAGLAGPDLSTTTSDDEAGSGGQIGGAPTAPQSDGAAVSSSWTTKVNERGWPADRMVNFGPTTMELCHVLGDDGTGRFTGAAPSWSLAGVPLTNAETVTRRSNPTAWISSCIQADHPLVPGIYVATWTGPDLDYTDAVIVGAVDQLVDSVGIVEVRNLSDNDICLVQFAPGSEAISRVELPVPLGPGRRTQVSLAVGNYSVVVQDCAGSSLVVPTEVLVAPGVFNIVIESKAGGSIGLPEISNEGDGPAQPTAVMLESAPVANSPVWANTVTNAGEPANSLIVIGPADEKNFCLTWNYQHVPAGSEYELVWSADGVTSQGDVSVGVTNPPDAGNFWGCYGNANGLVDGLYEVTWLTDGIGVFSESIVVGQPGEASIRLSNTSGADICTVLVADEHAQSLGLNHLTTSIAAGETAYLPVSVGIHHVRALNCDGQMVLDVGTLEVPASGVDLAGPILPTASRPVWTTEVDSGGVALDAVKILPKGTDHFCLTWDYRNAPAGSDFEIVWSVDGVSGPGDVSAGTTGSRDHGSFFGCYGDEDGLGEGRYEAEWRIAGSVVFAESISISDVEQVSFEIVNNTMGSLCDLSVRALGDDVPGLNLLLSGINPGDSEIVKVSVGLADIRITNCDGQTVFRRTGAVIGAEGIRAQIEIGVG